MCGVGAGQPLGGAFAVAVSSPGLEWVGCAAVVFGNAFQVDRLRAEVDALKGGK